MNKLALMIVFIVGIALGHLTMATVPGSAGSIPNAPLDLFIVGTSYLNNSDVILGLRKEYEDKWEYAGSTLTATHKDFLVFVRYKE